MHVPEFLRMGADVKLEGYSCVISGSHQLKGSKSRRHRSAEQALPLVIAGIAADNTTTVYDIEHIERGYENFEQKTARPRRRQSRGPDLHISFVPPDFKKFSPFVDFFTNCLYNAVSGETISLILGKNSDFRSEKSSCFSGLRNKTRRFVTYGKAV